MLLWDDGLIKVEICKKGNKLCHNGMIEQFFMDEGELMTIGADGYIKVCTFFPSFTVIVNKCNSI
jgi:hypothetical protein